jgi:hypothetical protein
VIRLGLELEFVSRIRDGVRVSASFRVKIKDRIVCMNRIQIRISLARPKSVTLSLSLTTDQGNHNLI